MALRPHRQPGQRDNLSGTNISRAGDYNRRVLLQAIRAHATVTRGELATITGLTHQSAINISNRLVADGLVLEVGRSSGGRGMPATQLSINADGAYALGLNIDRDHVTLVLMDLAGIVRERFFLDKHFALPSAVIDFVLGAIDSIFKRKLISRRRLIGLGVAIPERLAGVSVAGRPSDYDEWARIDIIKALSAAIALPVYCENDATSAAIGELHFGRSPGHNTFVYTLISAGLGCGLIINGQPYTGALTHAGEIGNIPIHHSDPAKTYLWHAVSLYALYAELASRGVLVEKIDSIDPDDFATDMAVDAWVTQAAECMIEPFLAITYILSPEAHFIGGQLPSFVAQKLCDALNAKLPKFFRDVELTKFQPATTSVDASALGAAVLVFQHRLLPSPEVLRNRSTR